MDDHGCGARAVSAATETIRAMPIADLFSPHELALWDLDASVKRLVMVSQLRSLDRSVGLRLNSDWRMYGFERNLTRWPDGRFYLLDRGYGLWRGHRISFTRAELDEIGCDAWAQSSIRLAFTDRFAPLEADCFRDHPSSLLRYIELIDRIRSEFAAQSTA